MKKMRGFAVLVLMALPGCGGDDLPDYFTLGKLRVLAIQADSPEVDPTAGTLVTLTPLITAKTAGAAAGTDPLTLNYVFEHCLDPGVSIGADPSCTGNSTVTSQTGTVTVASGSGAYTGTGTHSGALTLTVPPTIFTAGVRGSASTQDRFNGVPYLVTYRLTAPNGETVSAFRRIVATSRTPLNRNPTVTAIQKDGSTLTSLPASESTLTPLLGAGAAESYSVQLGNGALSSKTERITVSWFISQGEMKYSRTDRESSNVYTPSTAPAGAVFLTAVVRDDRGGVGFLSSTVGP